MPFGGGGRKLTFVLVCVAHLCRVPCLRLRSFHFALSPLAYVCCPIADLLLTLQGKGKVWPPWGFPFEGCLFFPFSDKKKK